jgi:flagellar hook-associated protein 1
MSISSAFNSAASGLKANSRLVDTVAKNVSNALTEGYARRTTELSSTFLGGIGSGVSVVGTTRAESPYLTAERRGADAALGASSALSGAYSRIIELIGTSADEPTSLMGLTDKLGSALITVAASPDSTTEQTTALNAARTLAAKLNTITLENNQIRTDVESQITAQVDYVNTSLHSVDALNEKIATLRTQGADTTSLEDERMRLIDGISSVIPVSTVKRDNGMVAIYSTNGGALLKSDVYELSFDAHNGGVTADMTLGAPLGSLMHNQGGNSGPVAVDAGIGSGIFDGGSLGALFELRDSVLPDYQTEVDAFATDLIERFRDLMPAGFLDGSGDGIFVDAGSGRGVAGRIAVNAAVDPAQGGDVWRLRDGLSAIAQGDKGNTTYLLALSDAISVERSPSGFTYQTAATGSSGMASGIASFFSGLSSRADENTSYFSSLQSALAQSEINDIGVDSDQELSNLMVLEDAYAANARVLETIGTLMQQLLEI